jgi:DNA-binding MarR family transcriptional regulator
MNVSDDLHDRWVEEGWGQAARGLAAVMELDRAHRTLVNRADELLQQCNLSLARYEVLQLLCFTRDGRMSVSRLSRLLQVHSTSGTSAVDRLVEAGLVQRHRDPEDARVAVVAITVRGRSVTSKATVELNAGLFTDLGLTPKQLDLLWSVLRSLRSNAGDFLPRGLHVDSNPTPPFDGVFTADERKSRT